MPQRKLMEAVGTVKDFLVWGEKKKVLETASTTIPLDMRANMRVKIREKYLNPAKEEIIARAISTVVRDPRWVRPITTALDIYQKVPKEWHDIPGYVPTAAVGAKATAETLAAVRAGGPPSALQKWGPQVGAALGGLGASRYIGDPGYRERIREELHGGASYAPIWGVEPFDFYRHGARIAGLGEEMARNIPHLWRHPSPYVRGFASGIGEQLGYTRKGLGIAGEEIASQLERLRPVQPILWGGAYQPRGERVF